MVYNGDVLKEWIEEREHMTDSHFISRLPDVEESRCIFQAAAMLEAILMPEWEYRYYSYNAHWDEKEQMASMRDGEGEHYFALFQPEGLIIKGYDRRFSRGGWPAGCAARRA